MLVRCQDSSLGWPKVLQARKAKRAVVLQAESGLGFVDGYRVGGIKLSVVRVASHRRAFRLILGEQVL
jgi:hypothetical protein